MLHAFLAALALAGLAGCHRAGDYPAEVLATVNDKRITAGQLQEEMQRGGAAAAAQAATGKQALERLIDLELVQAAAAREKIERDPQVKQVIERARNLIVIESYMRRRVGKLPGPTPAEIDAYFDTHPAFFSARRQFDMAVLEFSADAKGEVDAAVQAGKSLDEVAHWLASKNVAFSRNRVSRSTADLPAGLANQVAMLRKGQSLLVDEGARSMLVMLMDVRDNPVTRDAAAGPIRQFLLAEANRKATEAELRRLRAGADIAYLRPPPDFLPGARALTAIAARPAGAGLK